ncbi:MAG: hypothetical protein HUN04_22710 [Desulfobacter sp.]|nr:MAG: hypothetical protein HUN04_22710 [Desulfobacter sp.]
MAKTYTCECCEKSYTRHLASEAYLRNNCYDCSFWLCKMEYPDFMAERRAIIDGSHYIIRAETDGLRGFGGRKFIIQFFDGRIIETNNLWCQGEIPDRFRKRLPDNAVFLPLDEPSVITDDKSSIPF